MHSKSIERRRCFAIQGDWQRILAGPFNVTTCAAPDEKSGCLQHIPWIPIIDERPLSTVKLAFEWPSNRDSERLQLAESLPAVRRSTVQDRRVRSEKVTKFRSSASKRYATFAAPITSSIVHENSCDCRTRLRYGRCAKCGLQEDELSRTIRSFAKPILNVRPSNMIWLKWRVR